MDKEQTTTPGTPCPTLYDECVGSLTSPASHYLFIICLEILAILIRDNKDIQGIQVDGDEIKLEIFADDLTVFLRNHTFLNALFDTIEGFTLCAGVRINYDKTEAMFLGNQKTTGKLPKHFTRNITVKKAVKILGVHMVSWCTLYVR